MGEKQRAATYWKQAATYTEKKLEQARRRVKELELARDTFKSMAKEGTLLPGQYRKGKSPNDN